MSVLIKGMDMPTSCDDCEFCKHAISGYDWCSIPMVNGRSKPLDEPVIKPDWCPLVHVPPHGRLIDADKLREAMYHEAFEIDSPMQRWDSGCWIRYKMFERAEENAPTIIPAEGEED